MSVFFFFFSSSSLFVIQSHRHLISFSFDVCVRCRFVKCQIVIQTSYWWMWDWWSCSRVPIGESALCMLGYMQTGMAERYFTLIWKWRNGVKCRAVRVWNMNPHRSDILERKVLRTMYGPVRDGDVWRRRFNHEQIGAQGSSLSSSQTA